MTQRAFGKNVGLNCSKTFNDERTQKVISTLSYCSSLIPAVAPRKRIVDLCLLAGMVLVMFSMQVSNPFHAMASFSGSTFISEIGTPVGTMPS